MTHFSGFLIFKIYKILDIFYMVLLWWCQTGFEVLMKKLIASTCISLTCYSVFTSLGEH